MEDYMKSGRMLLRLSAAIGRLVLAGRELTRLTGFTARISQLITVRVLVWMCCYVHLPAYYGACACVDVLFGVRTDMWVYYLTAHISSGAPSLPRTPTRTYAHAHTPVVILLLCVWCGKSH